MNDIQYKLLAHLLNSIIGMDIWVGNQQSQAQAKSLVCDAINRSEGFP